MSITVSVFYNVFVSEDLPYMSYSFLLQFEIVSTWHQVLTHLIRLTLYHLTAVELPRFVATLRSLDLDFVNFLLLFFHKNLISYR